MRKVSNFLQVVFKESTNKVIENASVTYFQEEMSTISSNDIALLACLQVFSCLLVIDKKSVEGEETNIILTNVYSIHI